MQAGRGVPGVDAQTAPQYSSRIEVIGCGVNREGLHYTSVVCRHTQCLNPDCGQHRIDRFYENSCE